MNARSSDGNFERSARHKTIEVNDATLSIINEVGSPSMSPRLLIQGLGCEAEVIWRPLLNELVRTGDNRQHLAYDTRGVGLSTGWPEGLEQMADDAAVLLKEQATGPAEVVGHSLGGAVAVLLAARYPSLVRSLVLMDSVPRYSQKTRDGFRWRADRISKLGDVASIFDVVIPRSFGTLMHAEQPGRISEFEAMLARQASDVYAHICRLAASADVTEELFSLKIPMLLASGSEDVSTSPEIMRELADQVGAGFIEIPNAGHNPPLEQPEYVAAILIEYAL